jgi:hypothetical protein
MSTPRPRTLRHWLALCAFAITAAVWAIGCDQGEGERCQSQGDCESPLVCNLATLTCSSANTSGQIDASVPDGPPADAAIDAIDAPPDAMIDAP